MTWVWNGLTIALSFVLSYIAVAIGAECLYYSWYFTGFYRDELDQFFSFSVYVLSYFDLPNTEPNRIHMTGLLIMIGMAVVELAFPYIPLLSDISHIINDQHRVYGPEHENLKAALDLLKSRGVPIEKYRFYIRPSADHNAYANGKNDITIFNRVVEEFTPEEIAGLICHEMGHHAHGDTKFMAISHSFSLTAYLFLRFMQFLAWILGLGRFFPIKPIALFLVLLNWMLGLLIAAYHFLLFLPTRIFDLFFSRQIEYGADAYAVKLGFGDELADSLEHLQAIYGDISIWQALFVDHPRTKKRIQRLRGNVESRFMKELDHASGITWQKRLVRDSGMGRFFSNKYRLY